MGSGNFLGHALPAIFFICFGGFFLLLTLKRCRDLQRKEGNPSFSDVHLPEQNHALIVRAGILVMVCSVVGCAYETFGGVLRHKGFFHALAHQAMYLTFFFVGSVCVIEGKGLLFPAAHRYALALTFLLQYVLWNEHAAMKVEPSDARVHLLQANVNLVAFVINGYSAYNVKSVFAFVASWAIMVLNGTWMFTAGLNACCIDISSHTVGSALVIEALFIATLVVVGMACFLDPQPYYQNVNYASTKSGNIVNVDSAAYEDANRSMEVVQADPIC